MVELTSGQGSRTEEHSLDATFACLASDERRRILRHLSESASGSASTAEVTGMLAADTDGEATEGERREAAAVLRHRPLPDLTEAGLVDHDVDDERVALADHPALRDEGVLDAIADDPPARSESLDDLFRALADAQRRTVLNVLSHQVDVIHVETLARELVAREHDIAESEVSEADLERTTARLHHATLPHLAAAELIEYDAETGTVEYTGHPSLRVPWMHSVFQPDFRRLLTGESEHDRIGEIEGRERVVSFGQSMAEQADEELFVVLTSTGLLKTGCFARLLDAVHERDVDVYLGTCDPVVTEYVREHAPEVVLWEPDTNWLSLPVAGDRVGRLVMADREAVMLGTLTEEQSDDRHEEEAIIGEREHDTLVTLVCQLLAPHLDRIDSDTDDIEAQIPL
ncbi:hypothetical protein BRC97_05230 [Halobacteriales archaeon QS_6_71_20]|nr:MAG: hypothetical protein BRC97_05230 [Halobacteriales archaeon QS_6_71_20]